MRLWHVECVVQDNKLYDLMLHLEKIKAYNVKNVVFANGKDDESAPQNTKKRSNEQVKWLLAHVKEPLVSSDLKEGWAKAGFRPQSLYGALGRAVQQKLIKKMADGTYKPVGGA